jgi:hypothetical protein
MEHGRDPHVVVQSRPYHVKAGIKSTEFWLALLVVALASVIVGFQLRYGGINLPSSVAVAAAALASIGYSRCRSQAKSGR